MKIYFGTFSYIFLFLLNSNLILSQTITQTVRGNIIEKGTNTPLIRATVIIPIDSSINLASTSNENGNFIIEKVPTGRQTVKITYIGYQDVIMNNIIISSAKETILKVEMEESTIALEAVQIRATRNGEVQNEMATVSARAFQVEETDRYAGSRGDPSRMASNFAGVQGADDTRNDIVIRGNSPQGVLWQVENVNIPNPNHFAIVGTAGGPVSILNNKILANSDFYTGAFPAEFGNSIAGVFDLKLRNGNNQKYESGIQFGFLGTELFSEGPLSKEKKSSFLVNYRYSTLSIFSSLGINIGTSAIPRYQDASFKLNFPLKKGGNLAIWGIGGKSDIDILVSNQEKPETELYGENDRDQYFGSQMGIVGATYTKNINPKTYFKGTIAASSEKIDSYHELVFRHIGADSIYVVDSLIPLLRYDFRQTKFSASGFMYKKLNSKSNLKAGLNTDFYIFDFIDSVRVIDTTASDYYQYRTRWESKENAILFQPYVQWQYHFSDNITMNAGLHSQYFSLNNSFSPIEPRLGFKWKLKKQQSLGLAVGLHSQLQSPYLYFYSSDGINLSNKNIDFTKSQHYVISYDKIMGNNLRLKAEAYYQYLYDVPVTIQPSSFSLINTGVGFVRFFPDPLKNTGTGENYGIELTLEKFFSKNYFFLLTGSLFESKYTGSDGVKRDTDFNGNYALNMLFTKEFSFKNAVLSIGTKLTTLGGRRYGPADEAASGLQREIIYVDSLRNTLQFQPYFRADLRISYKINRPKVTHEIALDLVNITGRQNILKLTYAPNPFDPTASSIRKEYQLGFLPIFYYRLEF